MNEEVLNGRDYVMFIDTVTAVTAPKGLVYRAVMCEVSSTFDGTTDEQAVSNKCNRGFKNSNPGDKGFTFAGEAQAIDDTALPSAASLNEIAELWKSGKKFWAKQASIDPSLATPVFTEGVVWISAYSRTAGNEDAFTFSYTFQGVGEPNFVEA